MANAVIEKGFHILGLKRRRKLVDKTVFGEKIGFTASLFGCWHDKISRPFMDGKTSYRSCLKCGARKSFNPETLETGNKFYYPPIVRNIELN